MVCMVYTTSEEETNLKRKRREWECETEKKSTNCLGNHGLKIYKTPKKGFGCDECGKIVKKGTTMHGCSICDFDLCLNCYGKSMKIKICPRTNDEKWTTFNNLDEVVKCLKNKGLKSSKGAAKNALRGITTSHADHYIQYVEINDALNEKQNLPNICDVCYEENFPVFLKFPCGHNFCALCVEKITNINHKCPKCRASLPDIVAEFQTIINPNLETIPLKQLQHVFPLICSVAKLATVTKLINMGVQVNAKGWDGYFPIHLALKKKLVKHLVKHGADVNQVNADGVTPLMVSSENGRLQVVKYLLKNGAIVNKIRSDGATALMFASSHGNLLVVQHLIENGNASVNQANNEGISALYESCQNGHFPVVEYLIKNGANVDQATKHGKTSLMRTCFKGHLQIIKYLINNGANINSSSDNGATPLGFALHNKQKEVCKFLLRKNANIEDVRLIFMNRGYLEQIDILNQLCKDIAAEESNAKVKQ